MHRAKVFLLALGCLLLLACAAVSLVLEQARSAQPVQVEAVATAAFNPPPTGAVEATPGTQVTSPPASTGIPDEDGGRSKAAPPYYGLLPFVAQPAIPLEEWKLAPQQTKLDLADLNLMIHLQAPSIEPAGRSATGFNQEVQALVDREISSIRLGLEDTPVPDPGGFEMIRYLVTSAPGWQMGRNSSLYFAESGELRGDQAVMQSSRQVLAVLFEFYAYTGGAHPFALHQVINYDLSAGKLLSLSDLFRADTDYLGRIAETCIAELRQRSDIVFPDFEEKASASLENYRVWNITSQGLLITFEEYQVAPYAAGAQQVLVPYSALEGMLDPAGPLGSLAK